MCQTSGAPKNTLTVDVDVVDPCGTSPCQNGGQCTPSGGGMGGGHRRLQQYTCTCAAASPTAFSIPRVVFLGTPSQAVCFAQGFTGQDCDEADPCSDLQARTQALNEECCNEPGEDCSSGRPTTCNAGCARVMLPFFDDCRLRIILNFGLHKVWIFGVADGGEHAFFDFLAHPVTKETGCHPVLQFHAR